MCDESQSLQLRASLAEEYFLGFTQQIESLERDAESRVESSLSRTLFGVLERCCISRQIGHPELESQYTFDCTLEASIRKSSVVIH